MSASFGSGNLFGGGKSPPPSTFGLRQRRPAASSANNGNVGAMADENAHPNAARDSNAQASFGKFGASMSNVRAPPRASLATAGSRFRASATQQRQQQQGKAPGVESHSVAPNVERREEDLSCWVIASGYRTEAHFRALYHRLECCGTITARRGGLACFGDRDASSDGGSNWVAVRYESALHAQKAVCQNGSFVSIGGSTMVLGVMGMSSDAAAKLGINVGAPSSGEEAVRLEGSYGSGYGARRELRTESDVLLHQDGGGDEVTGEEEVRSSLDSICGKVLGWFFMWDTQA